MYFVFSTFGKESDAKKVAEKLVREKLATCINLVPGVKSCYYWKRKFVRADEVLLIMKCPESKYKKLEKGLKQLHQYKLPEIVAFKSSKGLQSYLDWIEGK